MSDARGAGILCIGRLYCDLVFGDVPRLPAMGQEVYAGALSLHAGGGAVITAAHLAALGRAAHLAAYWPADPFEGKITADVSGAQIGHSLCQPSLGHEPQITVAISGATDRAFLTRRVGPAVPRLTPAQLKALNIGHIHIGELATLIEVPGLIGLARAVGATVSLDCSWDDATTAKAAPLIRAVDVFFPNEAEVAQLEQLGLAPPYAPLTVVKLGQNGATAHAPCGSHSVAAQRVDVVDTTGAGDAFNAGFLNSWLNGAAIPECLAAGNAQGARAVQQVGGFSRGVNASTV
ncbi:carbohydrate kinase family protein [Oceaniglobus ichthyenteri]|uniref:carbohydrate kinase family protein n=1 Tax=Oceaniglobus ichthyenteri TaxID=2136177 RepID=UPI000D38D0BC|nr:PfkB family carbohydrate kinase [Oceaniglobus ichthyenteri]